MYFIGVDVGTGSARAGIFDDRGRLLSCASKLIRTHSPRPNWAEQNSDEIWQAVCCAVKNALALAQVQAHMVMGIGFDATCSLVLRDRHGMALSLSHQGFDVLLWSDQRAADEAKLCNQTKSKPLLFVGDKMSPEMQMPKLLWLKNHRPDLYQNLGYAGDLADFLTFKATGVDKRSLNTLVCKWGYLAEGGWDYDFLAQIDLTDLIEKIKLPEQAHKVGARQGYLSQEAASQLGLSTHCVVCVAMIDAHAGAVASFAAVDDDIEQTLALVAGTSNCQMAMSKEARFIKGVWGPYQSVVRDGYFLNEGGQSSTGSLLNYLIEHYQGAQFFAPDIHQAVSDEIFSAYCQGIDSAPHYAILPDFLGNRAPLADPHIKGVIKGLDFSSPRDHFKKLYWAASCAIAYGTKHIMQRMEQQGYRFKQIVLTGGHRHNLLLCQLYADVTACDLLMLDTDEPVLLGSAMLAALASGVDDALSRMKPRISLITANSLQTAMHNRRFEEFLALYSLYRSA